MVYIFTSPSTRGSAMNKHGSKWIRPAKRLAIYLRDRFICTYCGRDLHNAPASQVTLDHVLPRSKGGSNDQANLVTACLGCNSSRQDQVLATWLAANGLNEGAILGRVGSLVATPLNMDLARAVIAGRQG